jgi:hypothetical protein
MPGPPRCILPISQLLCTSIELSLKAFLRHNGANEDKLVKLGHDIPLILKEAVGVGLLDTGSRKYVLTVVSQNYTEKTFVYPEQGLMHSIATWRLRALCHELLVEAFTTIKGASDFASMSRDPGLCIRRKRSGERGIRTLRRNAQPRSSGMRHNVPIRDLVATVQSTTVSSQTGLVDGLVTYWAMNVARRTPRRAVYARRTGRSWQLFKRRPQRIRLCAQRWKGLRRTRPGTRRLHGISRSGPSLGSPPRPAAMLTVLARRRLAICGPSLRENRTLSLRTCLAFRARLWPSPWSMHSGQPFGARQPDGR